MDKKYFESIEEIVIKNEFQIYDIEYLKEGSNFFLRVKIEKENELISLDDCVLVTRALNEFLDSIENEIKDEYTLEVCSPGIIRTLTKEKHYIREIGKKITLKLYKKHPELGVKVIEDTLQAVESDGIVISDLKISYQEISSAKTIFETRRQDD
ncbi:MAG: ribosome maturation factor RimP [Mycoplasmatales bacterium]